MNIPGRYFRAGLGELPDPNAIERGEYGALPPMGLPPRGGDYAPSADPSQGMQDISLSERQSNWQVVVFTSSATIGAFTLVQPVTNRKFFLIQNKSAAGTLFVGFGWQPNALNGLVLPPGVGFEPFSYPINDIWVSGTAASMSGLLIYGT